MTVYIVTDLGYGDSGKGTTVDFLARQGDSVVVRHNGGPQAGHNVVTPEGLHHEFSQFGSGTFAGAQTYLSKYMLINPGDMIREAVHLTMCGLSQKAIWDNLYIDMNAKIITPFHVAFNRLQSYARGESCGRGIGECMRQDIDRPDLTIRVKDTMFTNPAMVSLEHKLNTLREYFRDMAPDGPEATMLFDVEMPAILTSLYHDWRAAGWCAVEDATWLSSAALNKNIIFEGAQGVLLDEWYGFHPYTTWSTTTHKNALQLLAEASYDGPLMRLGVIRAYMTRHGAGPFVSEDEELHFDEPHNTHGAWQGAFRQGHLDTVMLQYALDACDGVDGLVVTHLDRADYWKVVDRYSFDWLDNWAPVKIMFKPTHNLKTQEDLTHYLFSASPITNGDTVDTDELLKIIGRYAPIHITSHGPTHADKKWARQESLV